MPVKLVGRTHSQVGKRLWEIIGSLKGFGVGRYVVRSTKEKYPGMSYYKILSARPDFNIGRPFMDEDNIKGKVLAEVVFQGRNMGVRDISKIAYKTDYKLVHKHDEHKCIEACKDVPPKEVKVFPQTIEMPPLLKIIAERENHGTTELKFMLNSNTLAHHRIAKDGETPTVQVSLGLQPSQVSKLIEGIENK